jgi:hypothetical protein
MLNAQGMQDAAISRGTGWCETWQFYMFRTLTTPPCLFPPPFESFTALRMASKLHIQEGIVLKSLWLCKLLLWDWGRDISVRAAMRWF